MKRTLVAIVFLTIVFALAAYAPPHPKYNGKVKLPSSHSTEIFGGQNQQRNGNVPDSVLVLMVQFSDVHFVDTPNPDADSLVHDHAYFDRYMFHLTDYYNDASHGLYQLQYTVHDPVITLAHTMGYYGVDDTTLAVTRQAEFARDIVLAADNDVDFTQYDAILVFHAGAGQESDIDRIRTSELWSTFISRLDLQYGFDPENDDYPGIPTNDGKYVKEMAVLPEWEWQDYYPTSYPGFRLGMLGVLANQFGHVLGMPNLYDNDWSNGASEGVGDFCIMSTGAWVGNGYVPSLPSAYIRTRMGWEQPTVITTDTPQITVDYLLSHNIDTIKVVKLPISEHEYFLLENRNQNPDNSTLNGIPNFTFTLLQEGQAYYPQPDTLLEPIPKFEFMQNRYKGCEWDFFLPGYGTTDPPQDGSGILIWHVDENVIQANYRPAEGYDRVNWDATHKGVDLEEASGIQDLDATNISNPYFRGGPNDSYRVGNNTYFGQAEHDGYLSQPTAASYYGGIPLEISNISAAGINMTFDVKFRWSLDAGYVGDNPLPAAFIDFDRDGSEELFYPMPNGKLVMWKNGIEVPLSAPTMNPISKLYAFDADNGMLFIPYDYNNNQNAVLFRMKEDETNLYFVRANRTWASCPVINDDNVVLLALNHTQADSSEIVIQNETLENDRVILPVQGKISSNVIFSDQKILFITRNDGSYHLNNISYASHEDTISLLSIPGDSLVTSIALAPLFESVAGETAPLESQYDLVICAGMEMYVCNLNGVVKEGYPVDIPFSHNALPSFADVDQNGHLEVLVGGENSIAVYGYDGSLMNHPLTTVTNPDTLKISGGIWAADINGDSKMEILGNMSKNRLFVWNVKGFPPYHPLPGFPDAMPERSITYPLVGKDTDSLATVYIYSATNSGKIYRSRIEDITSTTGRSGWYCEYGNLKRNAVYHNQEQTNLYVTGKLFVPGEVYIYPNPWKRIFAPEIIFRIMTSRQAKVNVRIFDIAGKKLYDKEITCEAYLPNHQKIQLPVFKMASGVYLAEISSGGERKSLKFAIEK